MKLVLCLVALAAVYFAVDAKKSPPKVQVYTSKPGQFGQNNTLICHVSGFHPPDITIGLLKNNQEMSNTSQTDLAFHQNWHFHLTKSAPFNPKSTDKYTCRVTHGSDTKDYAWEPNM
ncbi:beta-2-microglobulin-like [Myripristis murdjan]|uniref:Beta-2-microglobulin n=1 Tax=Myripristis murdjan TaxID=586833 RepID=A0A667Y2V0_9TELE|nr:beta-2-microglobulin-like [Myripristis murdjan]